MYIYIMALAMTIHIAMHIGMTMGYAMAIGIPYPGSHLRAPLEPERTNKRVRHINIYIYIYFNISYI